MSRPAHGVDPVGDARVVAVLDHAAQLINPALDLVAADPLGLKARTFGRDPNLGWDAGISDWSFADLIEHHRLLEHLRDLAARLLDAACVPGTAAWARADRRSRAHWWVRRAGGWGAVVVAAPGVLGPLAKRLPLQDLLAVANQALMLVAVAREFGVTDRGVQVEMLAAVLFRREIDQREIVPVHALPIARDDVAVPARPFPTLRTVWATSRAVRAIPDELDKRPRPAAVYRWLGHLPLMGALADYAGERGAAVAAGESGRRWIEENTGAELVPEPAVRAP
ncbi:hypothetical protein [Speluncibacter jeojiensis]|uniref:Uncharacterized protein n=1 Tax=Speluncibacter jeojiensis TaxID=2710754 RepID=A0A9X4RE97_9ACTN|nr:hypothetical protein [Corynebacteriales bacterium D3-21]